jgi:acyl-CoA hydrolase
MIYRRLVTQPDLNSQGGLHGGILMKWVDESCGIEARILTGLNCVTRHISDIDFRSTAELGDILEISVYLIKSGRTSLTFSSIIKNSLTGSLIATFDKIIFVSLGKNKKSIAHNYRIN